MRGKNDFGPRNQSLDAPERFHHGQVCIRLSPRLHVSVYAAEAGMDD